MFNIADEKANRENDVDRAHVMALVDEYLVRKEILEKCRVCVHNPCDRLPEVVEKYKFMDDKMYLLEELYAEEYITWCASHVLAYLDEALLGIKYSEH